MQLNFPPSKNNISSNQNINSPPKKNKNKSSSKEKDNEEVFPPKQPYFPVKKIWALTNIFFTINYSIYLLVYIINIPLKPLPSIFNILSLVLSYSLSLTKYKDDISKLANDTNFFCLLVFISFPRNILLLPFYILSLYHLTSFILINKIYFEKYWIYDLCRYMSSVHVLMGRLALITKVLCCFLSLVLFLGKYSSLGTLLAYYVMIRHQYLHNPNMRSVMSEMRIRSDGFMEYMPIIVKKHYVSFKEIFTPKFN